MKIKRTNKTEKVKGKKNKNISNVESSRISFTEILAVTEESQKREQLEEVLEKINEKGQELINNRTVENLIEYKKMVRNFIEDAVDFGLQVSARRGFGLSGRTKILRTVSNVDQQLLEMTDAILQQESRGMSLLKKVGQIEGLLVDLLV